MDSKYIEEAGVFPPFLFIFAAYVSENTSD